VYLRWAEFGEIRQRRALEACGPRPALMARPTRTSNRDGDKQAPALPTGAEARRTDVAVVNRTWHETHMTHQPDTALAPLEQQIRKAWLTVRPDREAEALALKSLSGGQQISVDIAGGCGGDPFACQPSFGLIQMKWWALEVLWIAAYAIQSFAPRLARAAKSGMQELFLEKSDDLRSARDILALGAKIIEQRASQPWPADLPHPSKKSADCRRATKLFLIALGWIQQHEVAHIVVDRTRFGDSAEAPIEEERFCDSYATNWLRHGISRVSVETEKGIVVAVFFLGLRELLLGHKAGTHPDAAERIQAAISEDTAERYAYWLSLLIDILLQSGDHKTPASCGDWLTGFALLEAELRTLRSVSQRTSAAPPQH
jgi:hypothetical protein